MANPVLFILLGIGAVAALTLSSKKSSASSGDGLTRPGNVAWPVLSRVEAISLVQAVPGVVPYSEFKGPGDPAIDAAVIKLTRVGSNAAIAVETKIAGKRVGLPIIVYVTRVNDTPFGPSYEGKVISTKYTHAGVDVPGPAVGTNFTFGAAQVLDVGEVPGAPLSGEGDWIL